MTPGYHREPPDPPRSAQQADALAPFRRLRERGAWRAGASAPEGDGLFVAESLLVVRRVLELGLDVRQVVVTPRAARRLGSLLDTAVAAGRVQVFDEEELSALAGFAVHRGVLAAVTRPAARTIADVIAVPSPDTPEAHDVPGRARSVVAVLEDLTDQENLGAIARSAAALGVGGLLLSPRCADPLYRRTVRVSMGEVLTLPWARVHPWPGGLDDVAAAGRMTIGLTGDGDVDLDRLAAELPADRAVAVVLGNEGDGLSAGVRERCAVTCRIPMAAGHDSLNVAAAAAIAFHALRRNLLGGGAAPGPAATG